MCIEYYKGVINLINQFQKRVSDIQVDEAKCLRFLIGKFVLETCSQFYIAS